VLQGDNLTSVNILSCHTSGAVFATFTFIAILFTALRFKVSRAPVPEHGHMRLNAQKLTE
jgi:hypothetical protein